MPGVLGSLMALEVVREIVGFGEGLVGKLLMIDARDMRFETLRYDWDAGNPLSGQKPDDQGLVDSPLIVSSAQVLGFIINPAISAVRSCPS